MADTAGTEDSFTDDSLSGFITRMMDLPTAFVGQVIGEMMPRLQLPATSVEDAAQWATVAGRLQAMWLEFQTEQAVKAAQAPVGEATAPMLAQLADWYARLPFIQPETQQALIADGLTLWQGVLGQSGSPPAPPGQALPRSDRRFADTQWREQPLFALIHQTYLILAEQVVAWAESVEGVDEARREQLRFATRALVDALSPDHFPATNPLVIQRAVETKGESLIKGMAHLIADLRRGQLTHTNPDAFRVGENIAITPGKVVHETPLFQLIQYTPATETVLETPLVIFPPWINRFYILDLNPKKSFVKWAVDQGISTFMVSWKSADASMADVTWDDYIAAQIEAVEVVRSRLKVPSVHTIGYCVAGTTLAATLAVLARQGRADIVRSATFFTAQVDFEKAGELKHFIDDQQLAAVSALASGTGYLDGRYMAATFNLLRGNDLIWSYVVKNYLLGEDYQPFDLLHWNGDVTNLPAKWHTNYLKDLYRDNRLVQPDSLSACGTPIDLARITTPCFLQAGREDHIAPAESVWRFARQLAAPRTFVLAGSGHIAGVVNPPAAGKYQYWTNDAPVGSLEEFCAGAVEHKGSWWPCWLDWLRAQAPAQVPARGRRVPGGRGDKVIEDAPGRYVRTR